jgi:hypothetical protein
VDPLALRQVLTPISEWAKKTIEMDGSGIKSSGLLGVKNQTKGSTMAKSEIIDFTAEKRSNGACDTVAQTEDFSLVLGGPLYQLLLRSRLVRPPLGKLGWRIGVITALAWLPLVPLTILGGRLAGGAPIPFLYDFEVQARLLFSLPLLILAETAVYVRMRALTAQFVERQIITENVRPAFNMAISSAMRLRDSLAPEIAILLLVVLAGPSIWQTSLALHSNTWHATSTGSGAGLSLAGRWYAFVSVPVFQFILLRWYYRIFIWCRFLFQVSRLDLNLVPTHPDRSCGLGFLGTVASAFAPLLIAHSALVAGFIANRILYEGAKLPNYKFEISGLTVLLLIIVLGPLCVFTPGLNRARVAGLRTYGRLASDYVVSFAGKWTRGAMPAGEPLVGSADIQSLADLDSSFAIVREMRLAPFGRETVLRLILYIVLPFGPLVLTMFSLEELIKRLINIVL